jgi:dCTP deaminase
MILSDQEIMQAMTEGSIKIEPFDPACLGSNSYDVHLGSTLATYTVSCLDARKNNPIEYFEIPPQGYELLPNILYLGVTKEYTETLKHVPFLEGKSSVGRLGIDIHATAGKGDVGFKNFWTLEISVKMPVRVYSHMPIGQIIYFQVKGDVKVSYDQKVSAKYNDKSALPKESQMWRNFKD